MKRVALVLGITAAMGVVPSIAAAGNGTQAVESQVVRSQVVRSQVVETQLVKRQLVRSQLVRSQLVESALVRSAALYPHKASVSGKAKIRVLSR
jgi:hypothetical protein